MRCGCLLIVSAIILCGQARKYLIGTKGNGADTYDEMVKKQVNEMYESWRGLGTHDADCPKRQPKTGTKCKRSMYCEYNRTCCNNHENKCIGSHYLRCNDDKKWGPVEGVRMDILMFFMEDCEVPEPKYAEQDDENLTGKREATKYSTQ